MLTDRLSQKLTKYKSLKLLREKKVINKRDNNLVHIKNKQLLSFTSNDYLSLSHNIKSGLEINDCINNYGSGSVSSAHISGYFDIHKDLENKFSKIFNWIVTFPFFHFTFRHIFCTRGFLMATNSES